MKIEKIEQCPIPGGAPDCPYCTPNGFCRLKKPWENCDDYYAYVGDEEE